MNVNKQLPKTFSSLAPISEVYSTESMFVGNQIQYSGYIKRDSRLLSLWSSRFFTIKNMGPKQITLVISKNREVSSEPQETMPILSLKVTSKCTRIEDYPCFGVVADNNRKFLISLPNIHECQKFHAELIYVKKIAKELRKGSAFSKGSKQLYQKEEKQKSSTNEENDEISQSQQSEMINRINKQKQKLKRSDNESGYIEDKSNIFQTNLREAPTSIYFEDIESNYCDCSTFFSERQDHIIASNQKFMPHPQLQLQKILVNQENVVKTMIVLNTSNSLHACIQSFLQLPSWNAQIKKAKLLQKKQKTYLLYIQFIKTLTANKNRCVIAEVSVQQNDYCACLRIKSAKRAHSEFITSKKEVQMELFGKIVIDRSNKMQKVMTIALSIKPSREQFELGVKFMKELRNFHSRFIN